MKSFKLKWERDEWNFLRLKPSVNWFSAADFDAWLADDSSHGSSNPTNLSQPKWAENDSSDEEIGIKLPQKSEDEERQVKTESSKTKADNVKLDWLIENTQQVGFY